MDVEHGRSKSSNYELQQAADILTSHTLNKPARKLHDLPQEVLRQILQYLPTRDILSKL